MITTLILWGTLWLVLSFFLRCLFDALPSILASSTSQDSYENSYASGRDARRRGDVCCVGRRDDWDSYWSDLLTPGEIDVRHSLRGALAAHLAIGGFIDDRRELSRLAFIIGRPFSRR